MSTFRWHPAANGLPVCFVCGGHTANSDHRCGGCTADYRTATARAGVRAGIRLLKGWSN